MKTFTPRNHVYEAPPLFVLLPLNIRPRLRATFAAVCMKHAKRASIQLRLLAQPSRCEHQVAEWHWVTTVKHHDPLSTDP